MSDATTPDLLRSLAYYATEARPISRLTEDGRPLVRRAADELERYKVALDMIADEQKVYKGHGDYDILPALDADEAQNVARRALSNLNN